MTNSEFTDNQNRVIALAGVLQAVSLVHDVATSGYLNTRDFETCINSLFVTNPSCTSEVYGSLGRIERGLSLLNDMLGGSAAAQNKQVMSYAVGINNLAQKLRNNKKMLATIGQKLEEAEAKVQHFGIDHDNTIAHIAEIYTQTISTFRFRIQVKGEFNYLQQKRVANQIRSLLLAAIRASILWRQNGGNIWKILLGKGQLKRDTEQLLDRAKAENIAAMR